MTYFLVNYKMKDSPEKLRTFGYYDSVREAYARIREMQEDDKSKDDVGLWEYFIEIVETVDEYPVPAVEEGEKNGAHD